MPTSPPRRVLLGRRSESEVLETLFEAVRGGESRAMVLRGEAGIGKTALLEHAIDRASGVRMARAAGVQSEMELAFAGLHQLCAPMLDRLERLRAPQRTALETVFALTEASAPDRFFVGLAVLSLFSEVAEEQPLVCVVDDAQWLDHASAQALGFVARRLGNESVGLVFAVRELSEELAGLPELAVEGLREADARVLLASEISGPLDARVRERIIAETRGNPLALLELPRGLTPVELAGGFGLPAALPLSGRIEETFARRLEEVPVETQRLLLVAAAEPVGDPVLVWRAAERLGIQTEAAAPATAAGLLDLGSQVRFRHPLVRSAIYRTASAQDRQEVHRALAEATDPAVDPDRRAWHLAAATPGPDEQVAEELVHSAGRAQARGGLAAAAAFLERSAQLTLDPQRRAERTLAAARAKHKAGASESALELLDRIDLLQLDDLQRVRVETLRAQIALTTSGFRDVPPLLLKAARELEALDVGLARATYVDALGAALYVGPLGQGVELGAVAAAVRAAPSGPDPPRAPDLLLDGLAALITDGFDAAAPTLRLALKAFLGEEVSPRARIRWLWLASHVSALLWDDEAWDAISARHVQLTRDSGALLMLPVALSWRLGLLAHTGDLVASNLLIREADAVEEATGIQLLPFVTFWPAALHGDEAEASKLIEAGVSDLRRRGEGTGLPLVSWVQALLYNGLGRYEDALAAARRAAEGAPAELFSTWALVELIEAATRSGAPGSAGDALQRLSATTRACGGDWALGIEARARALLVEGNAAQGLYEEAIDRLGRTRLAPDLARARLLYGEWLRRENRRIDAREQLHRAHSAFIAMGMDGFADRAGRELRATGATVRKRRIDSGDRLTAQEAQIAHLASDGLSNPEISARLFISRRTVEYHLHKVFSKLGISSRNQLPRVLGNGPKGNRRVGSASGSQT